MAIAVTYTFSNGTTADATQVNTNFTDLINGVTDGTEDININAITAAGTATLNGSVALGNASGDDVSFNGSLATTIPVKTHNTYGIGGASTGLTGVYIAIGTTYTVRLVGASGASGSYTLTIPNSGGTAGYGLETNGSGTLSWKPMQTDIHAVASDDYTVLDTDGYRHIHVTTGSSNRTVTLPTASANTDRVITIVKVDSGSGSILVDGEGSETVDGNTGVTIYGQYQSVTLVCNGSGWFNLFSQPISDALATAAGKKSYSSGTTYNGGVNPTVTGTNWTTGSSYFIPYQMQDGTWRLRFNITGSVSSGTTSLTLTVNGVTFAASEAVSVFSSASAYSEGRVVASGGTIELATGSSSTIWYVSGDVFLSTNKPTWAY